VAVVMVMVMVMATLGVVMVMVTLGVVKEKAMTMGLHDSNVKAHVVESTIPLFDDLLTMVIASVASC
jgi:hypothetical protein